MKKTVVLLSVMIAGGLVYPIETADARLLSLACKERFNQYKKQKGHKAFAKGLQGDLG